MYAGHRLKIWVADPLSEGWYGHDWRPMAEVTALRRSRLRPGALVFDLGAHHGVVALILAREVAPGGRVVAVEPSRHNADIARQNVELNRPGTVEIICAAAAARPGAVFMRPGWQVHLEPARREDSVEVPAVTVDALAERFGQPDVVFIDVEGAEHLVLQGAARVIAAGADFCVEVHVGEGLERLGGAAADVLGAFPPERYRLSIRAGDNNDEDAFVPFDPASPILTQRFFLLAIPA